MDHDTLMKAADAILRWVEEWPPSAGTCPNPADAKREIRPPIFDEFSYMMLMHAEEFLVRCGLINTVPRRTA